MGRSDRGPRPEDPLEYERVFWLRGLSRIAGVDEVGRGPLAGPVVAGAVILPPELRIEGVDDSKRLTARKRAFLYGCIRRSARAIGVGMATPAEIDRHRIGAATAIAMERALGDLRVAPEAILIDGLPVRGLSRPHQAVVGGDGIVHAISCASIIAKVLRDRWMRRLSLRHPQYGWDRNAGYGTREHRDALRRLGPTPHHRRSFIPVQECLPL